MIRKKLKMLLKELYPDEEIIIDYAPKHKKGDYATNLAFKIAARTKKNPYDVAQKIAGQIKSPIISDITVYKPGFINFELNPVYLLQVFFEEKSNINTITNKKIVVEYVSVNPTGPINIVNARAAAVGDSLVKLLRANGITADAEYYINDSGRQTKLLAESVKQRMIELSGGNAVIPEDGYHGTYLIPVARELIKKKINSLEEIRKYAVNYFIADQHKTLETFGVHFDIWMRESEIYKKGYVQEVLNILQKKDFLYKKDNAVFFKSSCFDDKDDRVVITSDQRYTYLLPDIAYHLDKIRRGYNQLINIWGPDHHGYISGLTAGIKALGYPENILKVLIVQEVKLKKDGKIISMSKRAGTFASLDDLLEKVPRDVVRFFLLMRSNSQHLDFDLDLALKQSDENPVYYVQYAYARIKSILRKARENNLTPEREFSFEQIKEIETITLVKVILKFPEVLEDAVNNLEPYMLSYYLIELARTFHFFYQRVKVITKNHKLTSARLALIQRVAETIKKGLEILGVSCPETM